jgi:hypothetical protein
MSPAAPLLLKQLGPLPTPLAVRPRLGEWPESPLPLGSGWLPRRSAHHPLLPISAHTGWTAVDPLQTLALVSAAKS